MRDFTISAYKHLLKTILTSHYYIQSYQDFIKNPKTNVVILRHDIDRKPQSALLFARLENSLGVKASYYFRMIPNVFDPVIVNNIKELGHEIGYHYENLSKKNGDFEEAIKDFEKNLEILRKFYPIKTICMHGSPTSRYDNRELWKKYNYNDYGIIAEPYFDLDFNKVFYITDASRSWNNKKVTVRDKVNSKFKIEIKSIHNLVYLFKERKLPNVIMLNIHPNNWSDNKLSWYKIFIWQFIKNIIKQSLIKILK